MLFHHDEIGSAVLLDAGITAHKVPVQDFAERLFARYLISAPADSFPPMSNNSSSFRIGQRVALSYNYVYPNRHIGQVVAVSPKSVHVHIDGECGAARFFLTRNGNWRSEFGRSVSIHVLPG